MQTFLVRAVLSFKVLGRRGSRLHRVSFPGRRGCSDTKQTLRSHHCQALGIAKQKSSHECSLPEETVLSVLQIDRPERKLTTQTPAKSLCFREGRSFEHLLRLGTIGHDVHVNSGHYAGRLKPEFPIPRTQRTGNSNDPGSPTACQNDRDCMRLDIICVYTRARWQMASGVLRLLTIISGPGRTPHSTQTPGRIGAAPSGTRASRPGLYARLLGKH